MIVEGHRLYTIIDKKTQEVCYCYPGRPIDLRTLFLKGRRNDLGYEIRVDGRLIAEVLEDGEFRAATTEDA